jgi:hypothetical protein
MVIRNKQTFSLGLIMGISFYVVLALIFSPIFGGVNGLDFADNLFNKLSKGSSYFIPKVQKNAEKFAGKPLSLTIKLDKPEQAEKTAKVLLAAGVQVGKKDTDITITGDLGQMAGRIIKDADAMYHNKGSEVSAAYGMDEKEVMRVWWNVLSKADKELKKQKKIEEANFLGEVTKKTIEPAYNFYKIEGQRVSEKAGVMTGLLVFYVIYTMWWGYAVFYMFDGLGLSMKKAKVKKEV